MGHPVSQDPPTRENLNVSVRTTRAARLRGVAAGRRASALRRALLTIQQAKASSGMRSSSATSLTAASRRSPARSTPSSTATVSAGRWDEAIRARRPLEEERCLLYVAVTRSLEAVPDGHGGDARGGKRRRSSSARRSTTASSRSKARLSPSAAQAAHLPAGVS
jgi:hypothetical protein